MSYELLIQHGNNVMYPPVVEGVTIEWERKGQPGKLVFEVVKSAGPSFQEGSQNPSRDQGKQVQSLIPNQEPVCN